jgi:fibronectin-binding autotransporter adhesin
MLTNGFRILVVLCLTLASAQLHAAPYTWDIEQGTIGPGDSTITDGPGVWSTTTGNWTIDGGVNNVPWADSTANLATFNGSSGGEVTVSGSFSASGLAFSGAGTNGYTIMGIANPTLALGTEGFTFSPDAGPQTINVILSGNNALTLNGGGTLTLGAQNGFTGVMNIGDTSSGNVLNAEGRLTSATAYSFNLGRNAFGDNHVDISAPGTLAAPTVLISGNSSSFWVGGENSPSSGNQLTIRNGAYFRAAGGNGTTNSKMGSNADSTHNSITVTGAASTLSQSGHRFYVGDEGSHNTLTVNQGGQVRVRVFQIGDGGSENAVVLTDSGSYLQATEDMFIGGGNNATSNSMTVANGANAYSRTRNGRTEISCGIGTANGAHDNSLTVTGKGSTWTNEGFHVVLGGSGAPASPTLQNAIGNALNIISGASATIGTGMIISGSNSTFNLGDGSIISTAAVGSTRDGGIVLSVPDARMNIDNGMLIANESVALVSGPGTVHTTGPAMISIPTPFVSEISSTIDGPGNLIKLDTGTLVLSGTNIYSGDTINSNGVLRLTHTETLPTDNALRITAGSTVDLAFTGTHEIGFLYIQGAPVPQGLYGQTRLPTVLTGTGFLLVRGGPSGPNLTFVIR